VVEGGRYARDDEVATWARDGWVLLDGLIDTDTIDRAREEAHNVFPRPERYHADPHACIPPGRTTEVLRRGHPEYPAKGPAFRPEQGRWQGEFPYFGAGELNRLVVHPAIVDFVERALGTRDLRVYQSMILAKYTGDTNYEQPLHTDRNHSWLPPTSAAPAHVEAFLYLSDVHAGTAPTHLVSRGYNGDRSLNEVWYPNDAPELYAREVPAIGGRGSLLAYRNDVFHRAVDLTEPGGARFLLNVSYKMANAGWIGYHSWQSRATYPFWTTFVESATPRELELFGFPPPGDPVWDDALLDATAVRYPRLDLTPWRNEERP
jgi:hypothetical protein